MADVSSRLPELFGQVVGLPAGERPGTLDALCGGDAQLRAALESLLTAHDRAGDFLASPTVGGERDGPGGGGILADHPAVTSAHSPTSASASASAPESAGQRIGRYRLLQQIGEGGFGAVFMAEQEHPVRRRVALKVVKLGMDTRQVVARFEAERQALAMMDHPNIAKVLDAGATESGRPYFVMELVKGVPITEYCDTNNLTTRDRLGLFVRVCHAVQHAHQKGIIHRDLKPSNILVTMADGTPIPKVIDFGIAKATQSRLTEKTLFTEYRQLIGTPQYMSPEQAEMTGIDIDTRSDVYSLGVLLYELLTGTTPFDAKELRAKAYGEIQRLIREVEPPKPSTRLSTLGDSLASVAAHRKADPRKLGQLMRGELDWIVMRCLEKDRTRRYETADALAADVQRHLGHEPVLARPATALYRVGKFIRRNKAGTAAGAGIAAALVLGIIGTTAGMVRSTRALHQAEVAEADARAQKERAVQALKDVEAARAAAEREARRATAANDFLQNMLGSAQPGAEGGGTDVKVADVLDRAAAELGRLEGEPQTELDARLTLARTYQMVGRDDRAVDQYDAALRLSRSVNGAESEQTIQVTADLLGVMAGPTGRLDAAAVEALARENAEVARRVLGERHPVTFEALGALGMTLRAVGQLPKSEEVLRDVVRRVRGAPSLRHAKGSGRYFHNLALVLADRGGSAEGEALQREAVERAKAEAETDANRAGSYRLALGRLLFQQNRLPEAEAALRDAVDYARRMYGDTHYKTLEPATELASLLEQRGAYAEALVLRREALARYEALAAEDPSRGDLVSAATLVRFAVGELLLRLGGDEGEAEARAALARCAIDMQVLARTDENFATVGREYWARAAVLAGLRPDRQWAGAALKGQATITAVKLMQQRATDGPSLDAVQWSGLRFRVESYVGDEAFAAASGKPAGGGGGGAGPGVAAVPAAIEGGLEELRRAADPKPGLYLFSLTLPRGEGRRPVRGADWLLVTPWDVSQFLLPSGGIAVGDAGKWRALFASAAAERRSEPALAYRKIGTAADGFGPARRYDQYATRAVTVVPMLPRERFTFRAYDGGAPLRVLMDGKPFWDAWGVIPTTTMLLDTSDGIPGELRVEHVAADVCYVTLEPTGPAGAAMLAAVTDPLAAPDADLDRADARIARGPATAPLFQQRGRAQARMGRFVEAAEDFARAIELDPDEHWNWYQRGVILAYLGRADDHREHCRRMLARFRGAAAPEVRERSAKAALLLADAMDASETLEIVNGAVAQGTGELMPWFQMAKGIAEYRAGGASHYAAADGALAAAIETFAGQQNSQAEGTCRMYRAMALSKAGKAAEARAEHAAAEDLLRESAVAGKGDIGEFFENWVVAQAARQEARLLFGPGG